MFRSTATGIAALQSVTRRSALAAIALGCLLPLAGCAGYQLGNQGLYPGHIRTVYVPVFESTSFRRNLGEQLTEAVVKEIELRTPYKVVNDPHADSVLTGRIVGDGKRVIVEDYYDDPRQTEVNVQVQVQWVDRRGDALRPLQAIPLPPESTDVGATGEVIAEAGQSIATGHQQAMQRIAEQIVGLMETPW